MKGLFHFSENEVSPRGISGFLLLFVILLGIRVFEVLQALMKAISESPDLSILGIVAVFCLAVLYSLAIVLIDRHKRAGKVAALLGMGYEMLLVILGCLDTSWSEDSVIGLICSLVFILSWSAYLLMSARVRATLTE